MSFLENGYELVDTFISPQRLSCLKKDIDNYELKEGTRSVRAGGVRQASAKLPSVLDYLASREFKSAANKYCNSEFKVVRSIIFNKNGENNWLVSWHQDRSVAVNRKFAAEGWRNWNLKEGAHHAQAPREVLESMVSIRIHLDDCKLENGCLRVIAKSHLQGIKSPTEIKHWQSEHKEIACEGRAGSALIIRPLLLHASSKAREAAPRRILHVECSTYPLPEGVEWGG